MIPYLHFKQHINIYLFLIVGLDLKDYGNIELNVQPRTDPSVKSSSSNSDDNSPKSNEPKEGNVTVAKHVKEVALANHAVRFYSYP